MKKLFQSISSVALLFLSPATAFAATSADPCPKAFSQLCKISGDNFGPFVGNAVGAVIVLASLIALAFLIYGGVKWIMSEGDKTRVEEARNTIVGAIIGLVIVILSYLILSVILAVFGIDIKDIKIPSVTPL